jgi:hypothetical protein
MKILTKKCITCGKEFAKRVNESLKVCAFLVIGNHYLSNLVLVGLGETQLFGSYLASQAKTQKNRRDWTNYFKQLRTLLPKPKQVKKER